MTTEWIIQAFTIVAGIFYMWTQITQHRLMWPMSILTAVGILCVAIPNHLWANTALNAYFIVMAIVGIINWRKIDKQKNADNTEKKKIHIVKMTAKDYVISVAMAVVLFSAIYFLLLKTNDPNPVPDALSFTFSMIAAWWLARSFIQEWLMWIVADIIVIWLYVSQGLWGMTALYCFYIMSSIVGFTHWLKEGEYV